MKIRLNALLATAGIAIVLLAGCVSSKKYKASQAALQQVRDDSARLAQQAASLNDNLHNLEQKNTTLQHSLDSASSSYAMQQKSLDYYQEYFKKQQSTLSQVTQELKSSLSQAGIENEDVQQANDAIYVSLDEGKIFKKNSTAVTQSGKQALNSLAQAIKSRSDVSVTVSNGDSSSGQSTAAGNKPSSWDKGNAKERENAEDNSTSGNVSGKTTPRHHRTSNPDMTTRKPGNATAPANRSDHAKGEAAKPANQSAATTPKPQNNGKSDVAVEHKKAHRKYATSEGTMTYSSNGFKYPKSRAWALNQGRVNTVANSLLQNGVPKVNVLMQQPAPMGNERTINNIKVIITPTMSDFNPQRNSSARAD